MPPLESIRDACLQSYRLGRVEFPIHALTGRPLQNLQFSPGCRNLGPFSSLQLNRIEVFQFDFLGVFLVFVSKIG